MLLQDMIALLTEKGLVANSTISKEFIRVTFSNGSSEEWLSSDRAIARAYLEGMIKMLSLVSK